MNIVALFYMVAIGLEQASCALVGWQIGKGDIPKAREFYDSFKIVTTCILLISCSIIYSCKEPLVEMFTDEKMVTDRALTIIWLISFAAFPDGYKGMMKGIIRALGLQNYCAWLNIVGHWSINITLQWHLGVNLGMGIKGLWIAKVILEFFIFIAYVALVYLVSWEKCAEKAK